jgi:hypothetical protein
MKVINCFCSDGRTRQFVGADDWDAYRVGSIIGRNENGDPVTVSNIARFTMEGVFRSRRAWREFCKRGLGR